MAFKSDISIDAGTTFSTDIHLQDENGDPVNLSGYTANSVFKKWYTSSISYPFTCSIDSNNGIITLSLSSTTSLGIDPGDYVYDVSLSSANNVLTRVVEGVVTINPAVTLGTYNDLGNYE